MPILIQLIVYILRHVVLFHREYVSSLVLGMLSIKVMEVRLTFKNWCIQSWKDLFRYFSLMYNFSRSVTKHSSYVCQNGLQETQNAALSPDKQPIKSSLKRNFRAVHFICVYITRSASMLRGSHNSMLLLSAIKYVATTLILLVACVFSPNAWGDCSWPALTTTTTTLLHITTTIRNYWEIQLSVSTVSCKCDLEIWSRSLKVVRTGKAKQVLGTIMQNLTLIVSNKIPTLRF